MSSYKGAYNTKQAEWAMDYMACNSLGGYNRSYDAGTTYDCGTIFCQAFLDQFPGRKDDPNLTNASKRLSALLYRIWRAGKIDRMIGSNEKYLRNEPSWQYVYRLYPIDFTDRKSRVLNGGAS